MGIGMSHSPMVVSRAETWLRLGERDRNRPFLATIDGTPTTFSELARQTDGRFAEAATFENLRRQEGHVRRAVTRLREELAAVAPDVLVVIGDDQMELFDFNNMPALGVYYGAELVSRERERRSRVASLGDHAPETRTAEPDEEVARGYGADQRHRWPGHPDIALHLIASLLERGFDVSSLKGIGEPDGIGHAFGVIETQLMEPGSIPVVPIFVNGYWPPNAMPVSRCYDLGLALRDAIDAYPKNQRFAVIASGGLSHFVTDEQLDGQVLAALRAGDEAALRSLPPKQLVFGSSEIRNWIALAAVCRDMRLAWDEYVPVYRTPAGTGCGLAFARWSA
jgi:hypothetical protein